MKPKSFVITFILALLIGWGLLKYNRPSETSIAVAESSTSTSATTKESSVVYAPIVPLSVSETRAKPSTGYSSNKERFEPNTASAPDHRPLY